MEKSDQLPSVVVSHKKLCKEQICWRPYITGLRDFHKSLVLKYAHNGKSWGTGEQKGRKYGYRFARNISNLQG